MALRTTDDDSRLNPGQTHADEQFNGIKKNESDVSEPNNIDKIRDAEESPDSSWKNNVSSQNSKSDSSKANGSFSFVKKKGPLAFIITLLIGGGIGFSTLLSPALLLVQIKETMVQKFDAQLTSMDIRTTKLLASKTTGGICGSVITIQCKYSTMSEKQLANFEKAGIKVNYDPEESKTIFGRTKPTSFEFKGETIEASEFSKVLSSNTEFRSAVKLAYNPKLAGFVDNIWQEAAAKLGISKKAADLGSETATDEQRLKSVQEDTKLPATPEVGSVNPETGNPYTEGEIEAIEKLKTGASTVETSGVKAETAIINNIENEASIVEGGVVNAISITGIGNAACTIYNSIESVGYAAKTVRALQLARYAMIFLNVADQIKAGTAKPEDVSYLGSVLTTEIASEDGTMKAATDSFGYKYAAYGETGTMSTSASQFLAGGGFTGKLITVMSLINKYTKSKALCSILTNPFVAFGSAAIGMILLGIPIVDIPISAWDAAKAVGLTVLLSASAFLPAMLKDIVAGVLVDKNTVGEAAGDALTSGSSGMMSEAAKDGGNAPLTPSQAVDFNNASNTVAAQYAQEDQLAYSPLDATNSNTFMGKIAAQLIPYASKMSSLSGIFSSIASITTKSFASITSSVTKAADSTSNYTMCQDSEYTDLGVATDPYCNITYGIPSASLNADPITVANDLLDVTDPIGGKHPQILTTGEPSGDAYKKFINNCINRQDPLYKSDSTTGDTSDNKGGTECMFGNQVFISWYTVIVNKLPVQLPFYMSNSDFYLHYIDQRVDSGMDN